MIILDSNVVSELMRSSRDALVTAFIETHFESIATTSITIHEIHYGINRLPAGKRRARLLASMYEFTEALTSVQVLELDEPSARRSAQYRAQRAKAGTPMSLNDSLIAGIVGEANQPLATRNTRDFEGLGLALINPWLENSFT